METLLFYCEAYCWLLVTTNMSTWIHKKFVGQMVKYFDLRDSIIVLKACLYAYDTSWEKFFMAHKLRFGYEEVLNHSIWLQKLNLLVSFRLNNLKRLHKNIAQKVIKHYDEKKSWKCEIVASLIFHKTSQRMRLGKAL